MLAYVHVQISPISCNVVGSILHVLGKNTDTAIVCYRWGLGTPRPVLLTGAKKSGVPDLLRATVWAFRILLSVINSRCLDHLLIYRS